jgi:hypothetical protein
VFAQPGRQAPDLGRRQPEPFSRSPRHECTVRHVLAAAEKFDNLSYVKLLTGNISIKIRRPTASVINTPPRHLKKGAARTNRAEQHNSFKDDHARLADPEAGVRLRYLIFKTWIVHDRTT